MWQFKNFDRNEFISRYWQKQPCVLRDALVNLPDRFESPVTPEELAGLACEDEVHCRLVIEKDGARPWELRYGPFEEEDFLDLPETHYSLLVSECEKWIPELTDLLDQFRFIPDWRVDDLMISYAPAGGSVGPHVDEYDVFLLQALGSRQWQYCDSPAREPRLIPNLELAILQEFDPDQEIVLNPGDMLYLPPGHAHHGIAQDSCLTYSIGFRAPTANSVLESLVLETEHRGTGLQRYRDAELELERHHAEITDGEIDRFRSLASGLLQQPDAVWRDAIGKMLSDSTVAPPPDDDQPVYVSDLLSCNWLRHPETRMYYHQSEQDITLYCNGSARVLPGSREILEPLQQLCDNREWSTAMIKACIKIEPLESLLIELASSQAILPINDE
jgi:50S ribosomal protein L16 3-hydroxylase